MSETSSTDGLQVVHEISSASKDKMHIDQWVLEIGARLDNQVISDHGYLNRPSIFGNWQSWDDFGASFLPEATKWQFVAYMKRWFGLRVDSFLGHMHVMDDLVWNYYQGINEQFRADNRKRFIEHLLGTSCFLIFAMVLLSTDDHLMHILGKPNSGRGNDDQIINQRSVEFDALSKFFNKKSMETQRYMLTMNYQVPWFVVEAVYIDSKLSDLLGTQLFNLALLCFEKGIKLKMNKTKQQNIDDYRGSICTLGFTHLLHMFHWTRSHDSMFQDNTNRSDTLESFYIPSATNLQLSQTIFEIHPDGSIDMSYDDKRLSGVFQLPRFHLSRYGIQIYKDPLRLEREYGSEGYHFTSYIACMVCLIKTKEDVQLLRAKGIIANTRNDDEDVLCHIQEFKHLLHDDVPLTVKLSLLADEVNEHHERSASRYYAELMSRYCSNPWITISVIAGICLFILTFIQTVYGILSYQKQ